MSSHQTQRFDQSVCTKPETLQIHQKACQNSSNALKCVDEMQRFCNTQIHTNQEFNLQKDVLSCVSHCGVDKKCVSRCAEL